ncbi:MAG: hypothetical protein ACPHL7_07420 [Flavobacteriaceae bacterium]
MTLSTKALLGNLLSFGAFFVAFRYGLGLFEMLSYPLTAIGSAIIASIFAPKFLVRKKRLYLKLPGIKKPKVL